MCGKDKKFLKLQTHQLGSPPHVRERPKRILGHAVQDRITPACAGKTKTYSWPRSAR